MPEKRKTATSTEVKRRYNEKTYAPLYVNLPRDLAAAFKAECAARGISQAQVVKAAIETFLQGKARE